MGLSTKAPECVQGWTTSDGDTHTTQELRKSIDAALAKVRDAVDDGITAAPDNRGLGRKILHKMSDGMLRDTLHQVLSEVCDRGIDLRDVDP